MSTVVAIVKSIVGQVIATSAEGAHRVLVEGDRLFVGDTLDTGAGGMVTLELTDGRTLDLGRGTQWSSADTASEGTEATAQSASDAKAEVLDVQRAIAAGADPTQDLAPTAAGPGAGGAGGPAGGSHSFVLLSETGGAVQPEIGIAFTDPAGGDAVVQEQAIGTEQNVAPAFTTPAGNDSPATISVTTDEDTAYNGTFTARDNNGDALTYAVVGSGTAHGSLTLTPQGVWTYTPAANYNGPDSFQVTVSDGRGGSDTLTVNIGVNPVNDAPIADPAAASATEDGAIVGGKLTASDVDTGDTQTFTVQAGSTAPAGFTLGSDGTWSLDPSNAAYQSLGAGEKLTIDVPFTVTDSGGLTSNSVLTLTITGVNDAPDVSSTVEVTKTEDDSAFTVNLLSNASDVDNGDTISVTGVAQSGSGDASGVTVNADGTLSVNPNAYNYLAVGESVTLTYTYNVVDLNGGSTPTSATITINGVNDAPVVSAAVTAAFTEDAAPQTINLLQNASDVDLSDSLSVANLQETSGGNASGVTLNSDGTLSVNPNAYNYLAAGQTLTLNYTYNVIDGNGGVTPTTATLTITGQNDAPVAVADIASGNEDTVITGNVLTNDSDPDAGAVLSVSKYSFSVGPLTFTANAGETLNTVVGKLVIGADGNFTFTPVANYNGPVPTVTYTLTDGTATTTATLNITVNPVNDAPFITAPTSVQVTNEDTSKVFSVLRGNSIATGDIDSPNLTTTLNVDHGTLTLGPLAGGVTVTGNGSGSLILSGSSAAISAALQGLTYKPTADYNGTDLLKITSSDGSLTTNSSVAIRVDAVADIRADAVSVNEDNTLTFNAITGVGGGSADNFENPDRAVTAVTQGQHGSVTFNADGTLVYTPVANYNGTDTFTYTVTSGGVTETATVTVTVKPVNDAAVLSSADVHVAETNDAITTGGTLTVTDIDSPATFTPQNNVAGTYGTFSINAAGVWTFTANSAFNALNVGQSVSDSFTVTSADGTSTTVKVTIDGTNDAPVASSSVVGSGSEDPATPIQVTLGGSDVDGTVTGYSIESLPEHGTLYANADGTGALTVGSVVTGPVYFVPTPNWGGSTDFDFKAIDNSGASSDTSSATINVTPVADAPTLTFGGGSQVIATGFEETNLAGGWNGNIAVGSLGNGNWQTGNSGNGVEIGSEGTYISGGSATNQVIELERNDGDASNLFTTINADAGETFVVQFQYSPRSGQESNSGIDVFWGGVKVGTLTGTTAGLTTYTYTLPADAAGNYTLEFRATDSNSLGGLLDNISVVSQPNVGLEDHAIKLSSISAAVTDTDGSEHISKITIDDAPAGSIISDGHGNTVTSTGAPIDITNWAKDSLTFTPPQDANGTVVLHVSATSTESNGDTATTTLPLTVTVLPENDAPTTTNQTLTTAEDTPVTGVVTGADVDGDTLSYGVVGTGAAHGVVTLDPVTGAFTYTPGSDYNGPDSFQVAISDGKGGTVISTISIGVTPVPDAPTVTITTDANNDGNLTTNEVNGSSTVAVTIGLPADAVVGNTLTVSNGAGTPQIFVLTPEQIAAGSIATTFPTPADGATLTVNASISDGTLTSPTASDSATIGDTTATGAPTVTITTDGNNDGTLSNVELGTATTVAVHVGIPADAVAGDTLKIVSNTGSIQIIPLTDTLIASGIDLNYLRPADGATLSVTATITDAAGNVSLPGNDSAVVGDTTATAAPTVVITTDTNNDGTLSNTELGASTTVTVKITVPTGTVVGDVLNITNPDGSVSAHPIVANDLSNGVELTYQRPADGQPINVSATITDAAGNVSKPGNDSAVVGDTTASPAPVVTITTDSNNDGIISTAELKATQSVITHFAIPAGAAVGDTLKISIDGHPAFVLTIDQYLLDHGVNMYTQGLADGQALTVSATITDAAGNVSAPGSDTATLGDTTATAAPTVVISTDTNNDGTLSNTELGASTSVTVKITVPTGAVVGDTLNITNPDGTVSLHPVVAADLTNGVTLTYARPADGASLTVSATVTDAAGNTSLPGSDSATVGDTTAATAPIVTIVDDADNNAQLTTAEVGTNGVQISVAVNNADLVAGGTVSLSITNGSDTHTANLALSNGVLVTAGTTTQASGFSYSNGTITFTETKPATGETISATATQTDAAGNTSAPGTDSAQMVNTNPVAVADHYVLGLTGQYFGYAQGSGANLENIAQVETLISGKTPDATFVATSLNYGSVGGDLGAGTHLQTFLGNDAASLSTDPGNTSDAIIKLSGQVSLDAGTYSFKVTSDDGFILRIDGQDVVKFDGNRSAASTTASFTIPTSGAHQIEIIYWDQGSDASLKVEIKGASDSAYTVLGATGNTSALVTSEDNALTLNASTLLKNDSDVDGDALTVTSVQSATHGNVALNNGVITFTPDANYNGEATFQYTVSDGHGGTSSATVTLYVTPVNDAPVVTSGAAAATGTVIEAGNTDDGAIVAGTPTVTGTLTATDVDQGSTTTWSLNTGTGTYGTIAISAAGVWTYTLNNTAAATQALAEGQTGHETFTATVSDGLGGTATQVITVNVTGTNDAPTVSAPLTASGTEDASNVVVNLLTGAADVDSNAVLSVTNVSTLPAGVTLSGNTLTVNPKDASFQSLAAGATKDIVVTYNVTDEKGAVVAQTATVTITGTNDAPTVSGVVTASGVEDGPTFTVNMLTNASDVDTGAVLSVGSVSALPAGVTRVGSVLTVDPSNAAFQALKAGEQQTLNITYNVVDDKGATVAQTATITITGTNDAPVVTSSTAAATGTVIEAGLTPAGVATAGTASIGGTLTATDVDHNSSTTWTAAGTGTYGSLTMTTGGVWTYTLDNTKPATQALAAGESTTDTFTATVSDGVGGTATQVITVTVKGTNDAPVVTSGASAATGTVTEAGLLPNGTATAGTASATGTVVATDADHNSTTTWSVANGTGTYGSLSMTSAGVWTYNLDNSKSATQALGAGDVKVDTFTATVSDGLGGTNTQVINVTVNGTNDAPVAVNDHYTLQGLTGQYFGYAQGSGANLATISQVEALITGKTPDATFTATTLNYGNGVTTDLGAGTNLQTFLGTDKASLSTDPGTTSDAIIKLSGQVSLAAGTYSFKVTSDDGFILRIDGQDVVKFDGNRGAAATTATYTIPTSGAHQIEIIYWDQGGSAVLKVETKLASAADSTYTVLGTSGNTSSLVTAEDTALAIKTSLLLGNDSDADGGTLSVTSVQGETHGSAVLSNGVITFTPEANYNGEATFQYTVSDGKGGTATANVTLFVTAVNDAPVVTATPVALTGNEDQTGGIIITSAQLLGNASDVDGNTLSVQNLIKTSGSGTLVANNDGTWTFTPTKDWNGTVNFTYTVSDGTVGVADSATLTVKPVADIVADTATTDEDTAITLNVLGNDNFSNTATISAINGVNITTNSVNVDHGSVTLVNGQLVFTPAADYHGPSTFTYTVTSGGVTETSTVNLTINSVSDASIPTVTVTPKGYWTFDSSTTTGNGNNAVTTVSNATTSQTGVLNDINTTGGSAIPTLSSGTGTGTRADGAGKYLTLNTGTDIGDVVQVDSTITNALLASATLTFWINTAQAGNSDGKGTSWNNPSIIGSEQVGGGNDIQWGAINSSGKIGFGLGNVNGVYSTTSVNDSQWHNVAISRDASSGLVSVYVDGKLEATGSPTDSAFTGALNQLLEIGATNAFTGSGTDATDSAYYKGALDDLRIYSGVLTADQVAAINHVENGYQGTAIANATTAAQNTLTFSVTDTASKLTVTGLENGMTLTDGHGHTFTSSGVDSIGDLSSWDTSNLSLGNTGTASGTLIFAGSNSVTMADGSIDTSTTYQAITLANGTSVLATGGTGADILNGSSAADLLRGGDGNDTLYGGAGNDRLEGGAGNDKLYGGDGNDLLIGGDGNDLLFGGSGNNIMTGGAGADTFAWAKGEAGNSTITDFKVSEGDRIDLTDLLPDMTNVNVLDYMKVDTATSTIQVSTSGHIDQGSNVSITLQGVDLNTYGSSSADIIKSLVAGTDPVVKTEHH